MQERETIKRELGFQDEDLALLCRERLIREEPRGGSYYYEISHDTLLSPILRAGKIRLDAEERARNARRIRRLAAIIFLLLVLVAGAVILAVWALRQKKTAEFARKEAVELKIKAEKALSDFQLEQAAKKLLEFEEKEKRALTILESGGCPVNIFQEMEAITYNHPDSLLFEVPASSPS